MSIYSVFENLHGQSLFKRDIKRWSKISILAFRFGMIVYLYLASIASKSKKIEISKGKQLQLDFDSKDIQLNKQEIIY